MSYELFPGFKVPPNDPSRDLRPKLTVCPEPLVVQGYDDYFDDEEESCRNCDGWGYTDCHCGGDLCVCEYNGEKPCWTCI